MLLLSFIFSLNVDCEKCAVSKFRENLMPHTRTVIKGAWCRFYDDTNILCRCVCMCMWGDLCVCNIDWSHA